VGRRGDAAAELHADRESASDAEARAVRGAAGRYADDQRVVCSAVGVRREQPVTEAALVVAIGRAYGAVFRACLRGQAADLAGRRIKRTIMIVRLVARHSRDQEFATISHKEGSLRDVVRSARITAALPRILYIYTSFYI
jgi:hypothetical protein